MDEMELYDSFDEPDVNSQLSLIFSQDSFQEDRIAEHRARLRSMRLERPNPATHYRIGIYIRFYNQTKYDNYLFHHKKQFMDTMALCPNWELIDFYVDEGPTAPHMENAPEWSRLIQDCFDGKIDLIITQKVSNVTRKISEITLLSRLLAAKEPPVGIYFVSEDIFTLASYYQEDLRDVFFLPGPEVIAIPDDEKGECLPYD